MNNSGHEAQNAASALEFNQGRPVVIKAIEDFRVNRVGCSQSFFVIAVAAFGWKFLLLGAVEIVESARHFVPGYKLFFINHRLEKSPPDNLETFLCAGRPPGRIYPTNHVAQSVQGFSPAVAAHLDIIGLGVRRRSCIGCRKADHQQAVFGQLRRLGQNLGERELSLKSASGQDHIVVQLASISDPLVDQHQTGSVIVEELAQGIAGTGCFFVIGPDLLKSLFAAELPCQFSPESIDHSTIGLDNRVAGRDLVADKYHPFGDG